MRNEKNSDKLILSSMKHTHWKKKCYSTNRKIKKICKVFKAFIS